MPLWLAITAGVVLLLALIIALQKGVLAAIRGPLEARLRARYPRPDAVLLADFGANSFGLESWGAAQQRGNGALAVTNDELVFFQYMPQRDFVVPLDRIREVSFVHSHLGKATPYRLLKVRFEGESGPDSLAFFVKDPDGVRARLDELRANRTAG